MTMHSVVISSPRFGSDESTMLILSLEHAIEILRQKEVRKFSGNCTLACTRAEDANPSTRG